MAQNPFQLDIWSILLGFGVLNGCFLAIIIWFSKKGSVRSNRFLSLLLLCISLFTSELIIARTTIYFERTSLIMISFPFAYLIAPLFLFYARSLIQGNRTFKVKDLLHLLFPIMALVGLVPFYFWEPSDKLAYISQFSDPANLTPRHLWLGGIFLVQTIIYSGLIFRFLKDYQQRYKTASAGTGIHQLEWLNRLMLIFLAFIVFNAGVSFLLVLAEFLPFPALELNMIILTLFTHIVGYNAINHPSRLLPPLPKAAKYARSTLILGQGKRHVVTLKEYMAAHKPFLNPDLTQASLAVDLGIPKDHLSQVVNGRLSLSFYDFVNGYRVREAQERLVDPNFRAYSILGIALDSGFSSKSSFNRIFKKHLGITPSQYLANQRPAR